MYLLKGTINPFPLRHGFDCATVTSLQSANTATCVNNICVECGIVVVECGIVVVECGNVVVECGIVVVECGIVVVECGIVVVECGIVVVECRTLNRGSLGSNPPLLQFFELGYFHSLDNAPVHSVYK